MTSLSHTHAAPGGLGVLTEHAQDSRARLATGLPRSEALDQGRMSYDHHTYNPNIQEGVPQSTRRGWLWGMGFKGKTKHPLLKIRAGFLEDVSFWLRLER